MIHFDAGYASRNGISEETQLKQMLQKVAAFRKGKCWTNQNQSSHTTKQTIHEDVTVIHTIIKSKYKKVDRYVFFKAIQQQYQQFLSSRILIKLCHKYYKTERVSYTMPQWVVLTLSPAAYHLARINLYKSPLTLLDHAFSKAADQGKAQ